MHDTAAQHPSTFSIPKAKAALLLGILVAGVGNSFVFAILPPIGREMGFSELQVGSLITASALFFMLSAPIWGAVSESWGRRPVILTALVIYCLTTILFAIIVHMRLSDAIPMLTAYGLLIGLRICFAVGICGIFPASQAYMADITTLEQRTAGMSLIGIAMGVGMISGPGLAAAFSGFGLTLPFYAVAALSIPAGLMVLAYIVELPRETHAEHEALDSIDFRALFPLFVISTLIMTTLSCLQVASGFYFQDKFNLDAAETARAVGIGLMASGAASVTAQIVLVQRMGLRPKTLLRWGVPCALTGVFILQTADQYGLLVFGMVIFGLGMGQIMPGTIASISIKAGIHQQGRVAGLNTSAQGLGYIIGPLLGAHFYTVNPILPYQICFGLLFILLLNVRFIAKLPG